jgi:hypothetical protein
MTNINETIKLLNKNWILLINELDTLNTESDKLESRKKILLSQLDGLLKTFDLLGKRPANLFIPKELKYSANASLGDLIETILKERGTLPKAELLVLLHKAGRLDTKNARVVLANALKRDTHNRFRVENGKVFLIKKESLPDVMIEPLESIEATRNF